MKNIGFLVFLAIFGTLSASAEFIEQREGSLFFWDKEGSQKVIMIHQGDMRTWYPTAAWISRKGIAYNSSFIEMLRQVDRVGFLSFSTDAGFAQSFMAGYEKYLEWSKKCKEDKLPPFVKAIPNTTPTLENQQDRAAFIVWDGERAMIGWGHTDSPQSVVSPLLTAPEAESYWQALYYFKQKGILEVEAYNKAQQEKQKELQEKVNAALQ